MKKLLCFFFVISFVFAPFILDAQTNSEQTSKSQKLLNQLTKKEIAQGWQLLFDGKTTNGWRGFKMETLPDGWQVMDGNLVTLGKGDDLGGDIVTTSQFEDFDLYLEWAISQGGNSGIFFHVLEGDYPTIYATGPEYQLIDDVGFPEKLAEWQKTGANYAMHNPENVVLKPVGEFNSSRILVKDGHVTHWLNGNKVVEYDLWTDDWKERLVVGKWNAYPGYGLARNGFIGLQDHGSFIRFRNIKIKDLADSCKSIFNGKNLDGWKINGTEKWWAENGELICESGPDKQYGYLTTEKKYKNFILRLRFKQENNGNSGVFFRSSIEGTKIAGWQVEVAPPGNNSGAIYESYGRGWLNEIPDEREKFLKMGEWNEMVILVKGARVMTWLNNELMTDLTDPKIGEANGVVALQIHDGGGIKVRWKDIFLREF